MKTMNRTQFDDMLTNHLEAGIRVIYIQSPISEYAQVRKMVTSRSKKPVWFWDPVEGFYSQNASVLPDAMTEAGTDFNEMLGYLRGDKEDDSVYVIEFVDRYLKSDEDALVQFAVTMGSEALRGSNIILLAPTLDIPDFLKEALSILYFPLPGRAEIKGFLVEKGKELDIDVDDHDSIADSLRGLGTTEIQNAIAKVAVHCKGKGITASEKRKFIKEKEQIIRKSGYLEFIPPDAESVVIGGLDNLTEWLDERKKSFGEKAREAKLNAPKGVLVLGVPGTGKSLCAKKAAEMWEMPLLRLDMGSVFSKYIGSSEKNIRNAISVAESLAPCVLWIDEIEKGLSGGASSSGESDSGTSVRVFGSFLTWMQEKEEDVFVFATANRIDKLPPEFLRKGRFDEIFFVDLPGREARKSILKNHFAKKGQKHDDNFISSEMVRETNGFSGAEIEHAVNEALLKSYQAGENSAIVNAADFMKVVKDEKNRLLFVIMQKEIDALRTAATERGYRKASNETPPAISSTNGEKNNEQ